MQVDHRLLLESHWCLVPVACEISRVAGRHCLQWR